MISTVPNSTALDFSSALAHPSLRMLYLLHSSSRLVQVQETVNEVKLTKASSGAGVKDKTSERELKKDLLRLYYCLHYPQCFLL